LYTWTLLAVRENGEMRERRSKDQIMIEILSRCANGENITKIVYQTKTNFTTTRAYLDLLTRNNLLECQDTSPRLYKTTAKGIEMMNRLRQIQKVVGELVV
jgi:predicted transcriptional regulator